MTPARPGMMALAWHIGAALAATALLAGVFLAWLDPSIALALADGMFLCR
ncbi:hypothetical protein [Bordetella genomosp. 13]|nr:hypothetical protein [Bordetella genomosp. 13]